MGMQEVDAVMKVAREPGANFSDKDMRRNNSVHEDHRFNEIVGG